MASRFCGDDALLDAYSVLESDNEQIKELLNTLKDHDRSFRTDKRIFEYKASRSTFISPALKKFVLFPMQWAYIFPNPLTGYSF